METKHIECGEEPTLDELIAVMEETLELDDDTLKYLKDETVEHDPETPSMIAGIQHQRVVNQAILDALKELKAIKSNPALTGAIASLSSGEGQGEVKVQTDSSGEGRGEVEEQRGDYNANEEAERMHKIQHELK